MLDYCKRSPKTTFPKITGETLVLTVSSVEKDGYLVKTSEFKLFEWPYKGMKIEQFDLGNLIASGVNVEANKPLYLSHSPLRVNDSLNFVQIPIEK